MIDTKIVTLLTLSDVGSYTKTAKILSLTQPAISHHIKLLEEEYGINIFYKGRRELKPTPEGEILIGFARKAMAISENATKAIADSQKSIQRFSVGITATIGEFLIPQVFSIYCNEHPGAHINILTDNIKNIYDMLDSYELDWAIVEGNIPDKKFTCLLLDTDYMCLIVSPKHKFAARKSISLYELKKEKLILRPQSTGTRQLFETHLLSHSENIENFNIIIELDSVPLIKELVASNLGVTVMAHSACKEEEASGELMVVPIENINMTREINMVYHKDFIHTTILEDIRRIYNSVRK